MHWDDWLLFAVCWLLIPGVYFVRWYIERRRPSNVVDEAALGELQEMVVAARSIVLSFADANPIWHDFGGREQDPMGAHQLAAQLAAWLQRQGVK